MSGPETQVSASGGRKLLLNGNIYYRRNKIKGTEYWQCVRTDVCKGTAITTEDPNGTVHVKKEGNHSHAPNQEIVAAERVKASLKRKAAEQPEVTPAQLLRNVLPRVPSGVLSQLPDRYVYVYPYLVLICCIRGRTQSRGLNSMQSVNQDKFCKARCFNGLFLTRGEVLKGK